MFHRLRASFIPQVFSLELRKVFAYRVDFWVQFICGLLAQFGVAWFLWSSIYAHNGDSTIAGLSFGNMMLYYLMVSIMGRAVRGSEMGGVSQEIYEGSLNKYLIYPVSFFAYKLTCSLSHTLVFMLQAVTVIIIIRFFPSFGCILSGTSILMAIGAVLMATILHFTLISAIELVAFWADNVWSLVVIVRFITGLLGGAMLPLALFPDGLHSVLVQLPFAYFISFPIRCIMGSVGAAEWVSGMGVMLCWELIMLGVYAYIWNRGKYRYSGVGI